jgi:DNA-directed RNA polymerase specialized sigma24 family protein
MERAAAIAQLPETYAAAIRLRDQGLANEAIAQRLGVALEAVKPLLRVAHAKLDRIREADEPTVADEEGADSTAGVNPQTPF